ncbi:MAG: glycosyltransferase [Paludibacteraceae bacterium]|nr:glycosyltransferase [Paludibacteraceae bacterium]
MLIAIFASLITTVCLTAYALFTHNLKKGWKNITSPTTFQNHHHTSYPTCTLVVAFHNEEANLPALLASIALQTHPIDEIIFIDDHSTDNTHSILHDWTTQHNNAHLLTATQCGKKAALQQAILSTQSELILCTDADCILPSQWAHTIIQSYTHHPFDILILPVTMSQGTNLVAQITRLEFLSLVSSGMALAGISHPIMCNGANLAFRRSAWLQAQDKLHNQLISGDDVFLLHAIKQQHGKIQVLTHPDLIVSTHPTTTISSFMRQRSRWGSKTLSYTDKDSLWVAGGIFTICITQIILYAGAFFSPACRLCALILFIGKWLADYTFLRHTQNTFTIHNLLLHTLILSIFYPFYIIMAACSGLLNNTKW